MSDMIMQMVLVLLADICSRDFKEKDRLAEEIIDKTKFKPVLK
jgi:hypothetical protein